MSKAKAPATTYRRAAGPHDRSRAFLDIKIGDASRGRIVIQLYDDVVPKTCENFKVLCTNPHAPQYKRCLFHRIIPGFIAQSGDHEFNSGRGGYSIFESEGKYFEDESFDGPAGRHEQYSVAMANAGAANTNGSQFFIELRPQPHLQGRHVVFGRVIEGMDVVRDIENQGTQKTGFPQQRIEIENCGLL